MMQTERDQHAVGEAVEEGADRPRAADRGTDGGQAGVEDRVEVAEPEADDQAGERDHDRHEPAAAEEAQVGGQLDVVVLVEQPGGHQADDQAGEDAVVDHRLFALGVRDPLEHDRRHRLEDRLDHQVAGDRGERGGAVRLLGEADRDTDGEQQRQRREDRSAAGAHGVEARPDHRGVDLPEQVGLAEPQQQAGGGQQRDGEHQALAQALELGESGEAAPGLLGRCSGSGGAHAVSSCG